MKFINVFGALQIMENAIKNAPEPNSATLSRSHVILRDLDGIFGSVLG